MFTVKTDLTHPHMSRKLAKCMMHAKGLYASDVVADVFLLLEELGKIEYAQDRDTIDAIRRRYGWYPGTRR